MLVSTVKRRDRNLWELEDLQKRWRDCLNTRVCSGGGKQFSVCCTNTFYHFVVKGVNGSKS